uniref:Histone H1 n=1 Tax=Cajanus cajan TaxID=3821 RepID=A0A151TL28_CAJCA|nr:Histone H1 [Cajanus cajan]
MAKLKDSIASKLDPSLAVDSSLLERRIQDLFRGFRTPTHPPYALMIRAAILGLNQPGGSTRDAISEFVKRQYEDLPLAHGSILGLHLGRLCDEGELARAEGGRYVLTEAEAESDGETHVRVEEDVVRDDKQGDEGKNHGTGRGRERVPKTNRKTKQSEEKVHLVSLQEKVKGSGSEKNDDDLILEERKKELQVQTGSRHRKLVSVKAKPQLRLRSGRKASQSDDESKPKSLPGRRCRSLKQIQK